MVMFAEGCCERPLDKIVNEPHTQISDMKCEHERRVEALLDDIKELTKEMTLQELLINYTIPPEFQDIITKVSRWRTCPITGLDRSGWFNTGATIITYKLDA